jgi:branched-chain amino acid transport system substrate-binding protein
VSDTEVSSPLPHLPLGRRRFLQLTGLTGAAAAATPLLAACGGVQGASSSSGGGSSAGGTIKIGYVTPETGSLALFGQADSFVIGTMNSYFAKNGITVAGKKYGVDIVRKDSQSTDAQAAAVANQLILNDKVNLILVAGTPDTTNPVADACEANGVPCVSSVAPWQSYFIGRGGKPGATRATSSSFKWTYHFFWGLEDLEAVYLAEWAAIPTNKVIGGLWPNDSDGDAFAAKATGIPAAVDPKGYTVVDPGRYPDGTTDFSAQITDFKSHDCQIFAGVPIPPDFTTFWKQAAQQGYKPKIANVAKALLFPASVNALGDLGQNLSTECWWSPSHPFTSSLTGQTTKQVVDQFESTTKQQWTQPIGFAHALFEVANAALKASTSLTAADIAAALSTLKVSTIAGPLDWTSGPVPNVSKTPLTGAQWRQTPGGPYQYDLTIVVNPGHPDIPTGGTPEALT